MEESDSAIVAAVLRGDIEAFEGLINRYDDAFRRYVRRLGVAPPHDDDVLQTIFLKVYKNLNGFNPSYAFSSWAYRIAHNEAVSYARKKQQTRMFLSDEERERFWDGILDESDTASQIMDREREVAREEMKGRLVDAVHALDKKYAAPLLLHFFEGKKYEEISDILRIPTSTVGTRIRRAKEKIRRLLGDAGV